MEDQIVNEIPATAETEQAGTPAVEEKNESVTPAEAPAAQEQNETPAEAPAAQEQNESEAPAAAEAAPAEAPAAEAQEPARRTRKPRGTRTTTPKAAATRTRTPRKKRTQKADAEETEAQPAQAAAEEAPVKPEEAPAQETGAEPVEAPVQEAPAPEAPAAETPNGEGGTGEQDRKDPEDLMGRLEAAQEQIRMAAARKADWKSPKEKKDYEKTARRVKEAKETLEAAAPKVEKWAEEERKAYEEAARWADETMKMLESAGQAIRETMTGNAGQELRAYEKAARLVEEAMKTLSGSADEVEEAAEAMAMEAVLEEHEALIPDDLMNTQESVAQMIEEAAMIFPNAESWAGVAGSKQVGLFWKCLRNIKGYQIEYSLNSDFSESDSRKIKRLKDLDRFIKKLKEGKKYYLRVRIYAKVGNEEYYSAWSRAKVLHS